MDKSQNNMHIPDYIESKIEDPATYDPAVESFKMCYLYSKFEDKNCWGMHVFANLEYEKNGYGYYVNVTGYNIPKNKALTFLVTGVMRKCSTAPSSDVSAPSHKKNEAEYMLECKNIDIYAENEEDAVTGLLKTFKGIGSSLAKAIYNKFGGETFRIIETSPERLININGISRNKARIIYDAYVSNLAYPRLVEFLKVGGFPMSAIGNIYGSFGEKALEIAKTNPYIFTSFKGVNFYMADAIASYAKLDKTSRERIRCASEQVLSEYADDGHTAIPYRWFMYKLKKILMWENDTQKCLNIEETLPGIVEDLVKRKELMTIWREDKYGHLIMTRDAYDIERSIATMIHTIGLDDPFVVYRRSEIRERFPILDKSQVEAVYTVLSNPISIITGGPGTGKTTIIKAIAQLFYSYGLRNIVFLSPTGKAARRMEESTSFRAETIHRRLRLTPEGDSLGPSSDELLYADLIFVDEASMLDEWTAEKLLTNIGRGKIVFVGDIDQLPSVGAGAFLRDIMASGMGKVAKLEFVHRQGRDSIIHLNAEKIRLGNYNLEVGDDFTFTFMQTPEEIEEAAVNLYMKDVTRFGIDDTIVLTPVKNGIGGVYSLNNRIQEIMNPPSDQKPEIKGVNNQIFRPGDPVIQLVNSEEVANGDTGIVRNIDESNGGSMEAEYAGGRWVKYERGDFENVMLSYAMTIHKSQGSEYKSVIVCLLPGFRNMLKRNLPYTAFTRARVMARYVGPQDALCTSIINNDMNERITCLEHMIENVKKTPAEDTEESENTKFNTA